MLICKIRAKIIKITLKAVACDAKKLDIERANRNAPPFSLLTKLYANGVVTLTGCAIENEIPLAGGVVATCMGDIENAYAKVEKILTPSPHRITPECPVYLRCGGCVFSHMDYSAEAKIKADHVKECFKRIGSVEPEFEPEPFGLIGAISS